MKIHVPALALGLAACAHQPMPNEAALSLAAAETAFAAHSVREDMRVAFLANFADDGVFVRGGWINANESLRARAAPPAVLDWRPAFTEVAASGELGLSTGPTKFTAKATPSASPSYGQYVSVWRRMAGGPWKVEADLGIGHDGALLWEQPLEARVAPAAGGAPAQSLAYAEARFARDSLELGMRAAYGIHGAQSLRFYRDGAGPAVGRAAALASSAMSGDTRAWMVERIESARSGDFGYARGRYAAAASASVTLGWYLRAWHREEDGWRIVMDVANPAAP
jgi:ketosteroid isomerase-like protein